MSDVDLCFICIAQRSGHFCVCRGKSVGLESGMSFGHCVFYCVIDLCVAFLTRVA